MKNFMQCIMVLAGILFVSHAVAADKVVVIPLNSAKKLKNVVTVSANGGDFTDPVAAVNSITGASDANPYLVLIGPGVYTLAQTLVMKPFVTISGSGQNATTLTGAISSGTLADSATVSGADNATLCDLTIENTGGGAASIALYNDNSSPAIHNVTARASGGDGNVGLMNVNSSKPTITNMSLTASGGSESYGVSKNSSSILNMTGVTVKASGGTENFGVRNSGESIVVITHSSVICLKHISDPPNYTYHAIQVDDSSGGVRISHSSILGNVSSSGTLTCVQSDNGFFLELNLNCT